MSHPLQRDVEGERKVKERERFIYRRFGDDVRSVFRTEQGRRVLFAFLEKIGFDASAFNTNAMAQSYRIGQKDAGQYWIDLIREHCPEIERKMRVEADKDAKLTQEAHNDDDNAN